eukprot:gene6270-10277_t
MMKGLTFILIFLIVIVDSQSSQRMLIAKDFTLVYRATKETIYFIFTSKYDTGYKLLTFSNSTTNLKDSISVFAQSDGVSTTINQIKGENNLTIIPTNTITPSESIILEKYIGTILLAPGKKEFQNKFIKTTKSQFQNTHVYFAANSEKKLLISQDITKLTNLAHLEVDWTFYYDKWVYNDFQQRLDTFHPGIYANENGQTIVKFKRFYAILRFLSRPFINVIVIGLFYLLMCFVFTIPYVVTLGKCSAFVFFQISGNINSVLLLLVGVFCIILGIVDIVMSLDLIVKCKFKKLIKRDVFYSRFQYYFIGIVILVPVVIIQLVYLNMIFPTFPRKEYIWSLWITIIMATYADILLILTVIQYIINECIQQQDKEHTFLKEFIEDDDFRTIFIEFAENEFSIENPLCYLDLQKLEKFQNEEKKKEKAKQLVDQYLLDESKFQVNVSGVNN